MKVAFIFSPPWDNQHPSYAMALFRGSTKESGHEFIGIDLNVDLYRSAQEEDKHLWSAQAANSWATDSDSMIRRFSKYIDSYLKQMTESDIDLYAMSITCYSKYLALHIAQRIKEMNPSAAILMGGPQCFPAYDGLDILQNRFVDAICTGEGDLIWPKILDHFANNRNLQLDIPGLSYRNDDGQIIDNGAPEIPRNLDSLPFADYSDVDFERYGNKHQFSIMTSRGCINTCAFCSERPNFSRYRFRSAENIYEEVVKHISELQSNNMFWNFFYNFFRFGLVKGKVVPYISFNDSLIDGAPKELEKFCDLVIDGGLTFRWGGMALIRKELTYDLLVKMKKAGCHNLAWGLESGCEEVLDLMHKKYFNMDLAKEVIKLTHSAGISQAISLIAGFPGETDEMFLETKEFVAEYKKYFSVGVQPMMLSKNSLVHSRPEDFGMASESDWLKWETLDGTNNYDIRLNRVEILKSVVGGKIEMIDKGDTRDLVSSKSENIVVAGAKALRKRIAAHLYR